MLNRWNFYFYWQKEKVHYGKTPWEVEIAATKMVLFLSQ
jgi:hypothetical protein